MDALSFILQLAIILFASKTLGILMRKLGLPQVLGFIIAGVLVGPAIWGLFFEIPENTLLPIGKTPMLEAFAEVGVVFVMFTAGLETDLKELKNTGLVAFIVALGGVLLPLGLGVLVGYLFMPTAGVFTWLFIGIIITATSVGITVETLRELGKLKGKVGTIVLSAAIIDDVLGIVVLSIVISLAGASAETSPVMSFINPNNLPIISILWMLVFFVVAIGVGFLISKLFKVIEQRHPHTRRIPIFSLVVCFVYAYVAEKVFGIAEITGAFIAGVILSVNHKSAEYVDRKITINSYMIFAPIFFAGIGIKMSFAGFNVGLLAFAVCFVAVAILGKILGCGLIAKAFKMNVKDSLRIGVGMIARGEVCLIVAEKGISAGFLPEDYRTAVVMLVLVSSMLAPILLKLLFKEKNNEKQGGENMPQNGLTPVKVTEISLPETK